ncbi:MAG: U32 family peptidase [Bacilli bacterium]|nr:U32 family peptidase [Bacilli bacterium]
MKHELLVPAGDMDSLKQAVANGADSVYVGCENFGARKFAKNFSNEEMLYAIRLCHLYGVKIYATMNTLIKDNEVTDFLTQIEFLYKNGIDAVLIQDFGMMMLLREKYPNLEIHASTQANISSKDTCEFLYNLGVKRVVFSREMSLKEIEEIKVPIEKEVFIHGALCVSYSGCCLMSSSQGPRSANRGECVGCCRMKYTLEKNKHVLKENKYLLSMKELNTAPRFKELLKSDITCFKIEGRMKSPEYVGYVTSMYRRIIDNNAENINLEQDEDNLKTLYNRGFTEGNLFESKDLLNIDTSNHIGLEIGKVIEITKDKIKIQLKKDLNQYDAIKFIKSDKGFIVNYLYDSTGKLVNSVPEGEICYVDNKVDLTINDKVGKTGDHKLLEHLKDLPARQIPVTFRMVSHIGQPLVLEINDGTNYLKVTGSPVQPAKTAPIEESRIREQIEKLGGTPFRSRATIIDLQPNSFIQIAEINELRRTLVNNLINIRMNVKKEAVINPVKLSVPTTDREKGKTISATTEEQASYAVRRGSIRCYIANEKLYSKYRTDAKVYYSLPRCSRQPAKLTKQKTLVSDYYTFDREKELIGNYHLNVTNIYTAYYLYKYGLDVVTLSVELNEQEIINLINNYINTFKVYPRFEVLVYGRVENMFIKGNILDIVANDYNYTLKDEKDNSFPVYFDGENTHILNYEPINIQNKKLLSDYVTLRYDFYNESEAEMKSIAML